MKLSEQIDENIKSCMKKDDKLSLSVLRGLKNALTNASLQTGNISAKLSDDKILGIIRKQISQREDSIFQFEKGNRNDLAEREKSEIQILKTFLPPEMSSEELDKIVEEAMLFVPINATSKKDFGKVLQKAMELSNNNADKKLLAAKINNLLN